VVPFLDLKRIHEPLTSTFVAELESIISRSAFINGDEVTKFEEAFAAWVGTKYCVGTSSGLDALVLGLRAMGVKAGDRVVVPVNTFIATAEAVIWAGATPVLVDADAQGLVDLNHVERALKEGAAYVLPVHLYGQLVDMPALMALADKHGARVLEDACQAHGAILGGKKAGGFGQAGAFSFYPGKNLGALGDGGALCTNDANVVKLAKALREHGQTEKYKHTYLGYTARLDNLQAAFLTTKLQHADGYTKARIAAARRYAEGLQGIKHGRLQSTKYDGSHVYHLLVLFTGRREQLASALKEAGIGFGMHYPSTVAQAPCFADRDFAKMKFPVAEKIAAETISLPIFPGITHEEIDSVVAVVRRVCG